MKKVLNFERFKKIINTIKEFNEQTTRIDNFFEKELMQDTWCILSYGQDILQTLTNMLADEFECWFSTRTDLDEKDFAWWNNPSLCGINNDIEWWLYEACDGEKIITVNGKDINVSTVGALYDYLMESLISKSLI